MNNKMRNKKLKKRKNKNKVKNKKIKKTQIRIKKMKNKKMKYKMLKNKKILYIYLSMYPSFYQLYSKVVEKSSSFGTFYINNDPMTSWTELLQPEQQESLILFFLVEKFKLYKTLNRHKTRSFFILKKENKCIQQ